MSVLAWCGLGDTPPPKLERSNHQQDVFFDEEEDCEREPNHDELMHIYTSKNMKPPP